jgi:hypothetical protein
MPHPEATPKQTGGICSTLTNIFSPGGAKHQNSSPSESSASYVDPDTAEKIKEEGSSDTASPIVNTLEDPTVDNSENIKGSKDNSTEVDPSGDSPNEAQTGTAIESNAGSEGETPQDDAITEAIADDPPEDITTGGGNDEGNGVASELLPPKIPTNNPLFQDPVSAETQTAMASESPHTLPEEWTPVMDKRTE